MNNYVDFEKVLEIFEKEGWSLQKIHGRYRVFMDHTLGIPWNIPVKNGKVSRYYVRQIEQFFKDSRPK